jgi:hypothetical protein
MVAATAKSVSQPMTWRQRAPNTFERVTKVQVQGLELEQQQQQQKQQHLVKA